VSEQISTSHGIAVVPCYNSFETREVEYKPENYRVVVTLLSDLPVVDEKALELPQIIEFRGDQEALMKYRRFIHWLDKEMAGKSLGDIKDEVKNRLYDYKFAVQKHGMNKIL